MRIAMIGAGAMGSLFAWHLAGGGAEVRVFDTWRAHVDAIRAHGLTADGSGGPRTAAVSATADPAEAGIADVAMLFVKFGQTRAALADARPMIGPDTVIVTLQNGIGNVDIVREMYPGNRVVYGFTTLTSELLGPGRIDASYQGRGETCLWPLDGRRDDALEAIRAALEAGGIHAEIAPDIDLRIWKKLIVNCCLNPMCAMAGLAVGPLVDRPGMWPVLDGIADEVVAAAGLAGVALERDAAHGFLRAVASEARAHEPSMLIDLRGGRRTEIDCLNGAVVALCEAHGASAPLNRMIHALIGAIETRAS